MLKRSDSFTVCEDLLTSHHHGGKGHILLKVVSFFKIGFSCFRLNYFWKLTNCMDFTWNYNLTLNFVFWLEGVSNFLFI